MIHATTNGRSSMFRYKLNENCLTEAKMFGQIKLTKDWRNFSMEEISLKFYIRTKDNPKGEVDYEEFNANNGGVIRSSIVNFKKEFPLYKRETLALMMRSHIVDICKAYSIPIEGKRTEFLIEKIMEKQDIYKMNNEDRKEEEKFKKIEKIIEKKITEIIQKLKFNISEKETNKIKEKVRNEIRNEKLY